MDVPQGLAVVTSLIKYDVPLTCWVTSFVWKEHEIENLSVKKKTMEVAHRLFLTEIVWRK
jgi:hypothetical protein